jgi:hypothetical protein
VKHIYKLPFTALGPRQESYLKTNKKLIKKTTLTPEDWTVIFFANLLLTDLEGIIYRPK